jgi:hypothetical protein
MMIQTFVKFGAQINEHETQIYLSSDYYNLDELLSEEHD